MPCVYRMGSVVSSYLLCACSVQSAMCHLRRRPKPLGVGATFPSSLRIPHRPNATSSASSNETGDNNVPCTHGASRADLRSIIASKSEQKCDAGYSWACKLPLVFKRFACPGAKREPAAGSLFVDYLVIHSDECKQNSKNHC